jgi:hypothetical protein
MTTPLIPQGDFSEITQLIHAARQRAVQAVNTALIELYWQVGQFYEAYRAKKLVTALLTQLPWTHNLIVEACSKMDEQWLFNLEHNNFVELLAAEKI